MLGKNKTFQKWIAKNRTILAQRGLYVSAIMAAFKKGIALEEAQKSGAMGLFINKYDSEKVKVYSVGDVSKEICGGPHANNTGDLVSFKIKKEESSSAGVRRIKAVIGV